MSDEKQDIVEHFEQFCRERRSMRGIDPNEIMSLQVGSEREVVLSLADLESAAAEIARLRSVNAASGRLVEALENYGERKLPEYVRKEIAEARASLTAARTGEEEEGP